MLFYYENEVVEGADGIVNLPGKKSTKEQYLRGQDQTKFVTCSKKN